MGEEEKESFPDKNSLFVGKQRDYTQTTASINLKFFLYPPASSLGAINKLPDLFSQ